MGRRNRALGAVCWLGMTSGVAGAQEPVPEGHWVDASVEYLQPSRDDRLIDTYNLHLFFGKRQPAARRFQHGLGLTLTRAEGALIADENGNQVSHDSSASGIGPAMQVRYAAWQGGAANFWLQASGSLLFYSKAFPYGGDHYNFMWRVGPALHVALGETTQLNLQFNWAHVSNAQGQGAHNPAYGAYGAALGLVHAW